MKIILIGFMGSGKSSVAKKLGELLRLDVLEMDELVLQKTNTRSMDEVFAKGGELLLRETEIDIARAHSQIPNLIISTGGGVVLNKIVLDYLNQSEGKIVFLNASFQTIASRLTQDQDFRRPLFKNIEQAELLFHRRLPLYLSYADQIVDADTKSVEEIAQEILL